MRPASEQTLCPACSAPLGAEDAVCGSCSSPVASAQRRVVTILFVDLVGYTRLSSELDVEEVHLLVRPLMNGLRRIVEDLGGAVPAIEGDGFMTVFGGTVSDPQDPQRAVVAAAKMQRLIRDRRQAYGPALEGLRVGVHVGEVLVAPSWETHGFSVSGDVVNVASRLCAAAEPGEVLASSELQVLLPGGMWRRPRALQLKNRTGRVHAASLAWEEMEDGAHPVVRPVVADLRGREDELAALSGAEAGRALLVVGQSGVGKSRLVDEWSRALTGTTVVRGYCTSFDVDSERSVAVDLLAGLDPEQRDQALARCDESSRAVLTSPGLTRPASEVLWAVAELLHRAAEAGPLVVVIDDVQWASSGTRSLIGALASGASALRLVLLSRTALDWVPDAAQVDVMPLDEDDVSELVASLLPGAPREVHDLLVERAGGLPLFVEQCVELLIEEGTVEVVDDACRLVSPAGLRRIPTAMRLFVGARLDMLGDAERRVLLTAAVLGERVDRRLLSALQPDAEGATGTVIARGLMRLEDTAREGEPPMLRFSHALVRDVAYASQLRTTRRAVHCAAADWYGILPAREMLEARAKHLQAAVELGPPDCSLALETALALTAWAQSIVAERPAEAVGIVEQVLALDAAMPQCSLPMLEAHLAAATGYELIGQEPESARHASLATPLAREAGDAAARAAAALLEGRSLVLSDPGAAEERLREAERHFTEAGDRAGAARAAIERAIMVEASEGLGPVLRAHEQAYRVGIQVGDRRLVAHTAQQLAFFAVTRSRTESQPWVERAAAATRSDDEAGRATVLLANAAGLAASFELARAVEVVEECRAVARACGADFVLRNATVQALELYAVLGDVARGTQLLDELRRIAEQRPNPLMAMNALCFGSLLAARKGDPAEADRNLREASQQAISDEPSMRRGRLGVAAQVHLDRGEWAAAERTARETVRLDHQLEQRFFAFVPRLVGLRATVASRGRVSLREGLELPRESDAAGAPHAASLARLWLRLDDVLRGEHDTELSGQLPDLAEARALQLEIGALRDRRPELLLEAAAEWRTLGATVWPARSLAWYAELTGEEHPEIGELLAAAGAGPHLAAEFRAQVADLR